MRKLVMIGALALGAGCVGCGNNPATDAGAGTDAPAGCADVDGTYSIAFAGCEAGLFENPVTITLDASCDATFDSVAGKTIPPITGMVSLEADGSFGATDLQIGSETLSCTGAPTTGTYVVTCGACVITLTPPA